MSSTSLSQRTVLSFVAFVLSVIPEGAFARGERVMGSRLEGGQLQVKYLEKMEQLDLERKQCRQDLASIVHPQLSLMDEMGLAGLAGPSKSTLEEARLSAEVQRVTRLQGELLRLGKFLQQNQNKKESEEVSRNLFLFEERMREYAVAQRKVETQSNSLLTRSEKAVANFVPFAKAVLQIKKSEACQAFWQELRPQLPLNMETALLKNRSRLRTQVAGLKQIHTQFSVAAVRLMEKFKPARAVAVEEDLDL